jgi:hypothetical protein
VRALQSLGTRRPKVVVFTDDPARPFSLVTVSAYLKPKSVYPPIFSPLPPDCLFDAEAAIRRTLEPSGKSSFGACVETPLEKVSVPTSVGLTTQPESSTDSIQDVSHPVLFFNVLLPLFFHFFYFFYLAVV